MVTVDSNPLSLPTTSLPLIAKGIAACWPSCKLWTLEYLDEMISGPLLFRLAKRHSEAVQWEPDCQTVFASVGEFRDWLSGTNDSFNPFNPYPKDSWWAYADYVYMSSTDGFDKLLVDLPYDQTFQTSNGITSPTFWLGSSGSNTLCHYDTYGVNIVVQVFGKKHWTLFPNSDTPYMYQTRLPLEESTVFSEINFPIPDYRKHPLLAQTSPRSVVLEPGDALFVPRGWWHFVQSTTDCQATCAVNWWIDQPELDDRIRLREALTQLVGFSLLSNCQNVDVESKDTHTNSILCNHEREPVGSGGKPLRLKCKFRSGQSTLSNLTSESTVRDLLASVSMAVGVDSSELCLFFGFPPKPLSCSGEFLDRRLDQIPLVSGDTLTVDTLPKAQIERSVSIPVSKGPHLVRLTAPSDNACLFTSVLFCVDNADGHQPMDIKVVTNATAVAQVRELIASIVLSDPERYSEAFLGMPNERYCQCIQEPDRWGGGIEVAILSQVYEMEICLVDIQTGRIDRFGEDKNYRHRILLIYDGIHYDPLALARPDTGKLTSVFSTKNEQILWDAQALAAEARAQWRFTDTVSFTLICRQCQVPLVGQAAAQQHAKDTGHTEFSEIPP
ncbi:aminotransferase [Clonorchis sinensis]|nr:aminotransferase [Clonorchis sinensis]